MKELKGAFLGVIMLIIALVITGCVSVGDNNSGDLPWSQPADWEGRSLGVPL